MKTLKYNGPHEAVSLEIDDPCPRFPAERIKCKRGGTAELPDKMAMNC